MSKVIVDEIQTDTTDGNVRIIPNGTGVLEVKGAGGDDAMLQLNCSAQSHGVKLKSPAHSAGQSYTMILPDNQIAANKFLKVKSITGSGATAVGQLEYADAGGGAFEFVQKMEPSSTVTEIDKTGLEYDTLYKIIIPEANFNSNTVMGMKVFLDNATTMTDYSNFFGNYINESTSSGNTSSASYWTFNMDGYHSSKHGGSIDFYTGSRPYVIAKFINPNSVYGFVSFWGGKDSNTNNTNNDSNQTDTYAKANGFRLFSPQGWSFTTDTKILLYKYKEA